MAQFSFHRGSPALDFIGTVGRRASSCEERLPDARSLGIWLREAGLADTLPRVSADELNDAKALREAMARVALALLDGGTPAASDIRQINAAARWSATLVPMLEARTLSAGWRGTERVRAALGRVAVDAIDLFAHRRERLMRCELAGCGGLLLSNPRGPRRRWCSMEACGNAAKVAAFRARRG
jgi:predicted RNA-binding Zn ribbon-like protein